MKAVRCWSAVLALFTPIALAATAAAEPIVDVQTLLAPGPHVVDRGFLFFGRTADMDYGLTTGGVRLSGPGISDGTGNALLAFPSVARCETNPGDCRPGDRVNLTTRVQSPAAAFVFQDTNVSFDPDAPFDFRLTTGAVLLSDLFATAPFQFAGEVDGIRFTGSGSLQLFGATRQDGTFLTTAIQFTFAEPAAPVPEPGTLLLLSAASVGAAGLRRRWSMHWDDRPGCSYQTAEVTRLT
jgi:hypothetical protein